MAKRPVPEPLVHGAVVQLPGGRVAEWQSLPEPGSSYRTEHFRTIDSLGLLLRNGSITQEMHEAGQRFNRSFVTAQMDGAGAPSLDRLPGGQWRDSLTERVVAARERLGEALDAVGGISSPGGCALWQVAGLGRSLKEWSLLEGWNGRTLNPHEARGILVTALGVLAGHYSTRR